MRDHRRFRCFVYNKIFTETLKGIGSCSRPAHDPLLCSTLPCPSQPAWWVGEGGREAAEAAGWVWGVCYTCQPHTALNTNTSVIFIALSNMLKFLDVL